jgi:hypothetical protein
VPPAIPTVALDNVARHGIFFVGGKYVGELGPNKESTMGGAMYVEVMVPKQIRSPYPVVFIHGAAQTGVDWLMTPDGRPGWASNFLDMGYVVYLQDVPARGRSQYVPGVDGGLTMMTAATLEERFTAGATRGAFPGAKKHTQWPGSGRIGDKGLRRFRADAGPVPRRYPAGGNHAGRECRTARRDRLVRSFSSRIRRAGRSDGRLPMRVQIR